MRFEVRAGDDHDVEPVRRRSGRALESGLGDEQRAAEALDAGTELGGR